MNPVFVSSKGETILIIEDEELIQRTLARAFANSGYEVLLSADGREGMEIFKQQREHISLVLLDWILPLMSGRETLDQMRSIEPDLKVIVFSGHQNSVDCTEAQAVVQKPVPLESLLKIVRQVLDE